jgi:hypothetical protein
MNPRIVYGFTEEGTDVVPIAFARTGAEVSGCDNPGVE